MFLSEKLAELRSIGKSNKEISAFLGTYNEAIAQGKDNGAAMAFAEDFAELDTAKCKALNDSDFALSGRRYPIMDEAHAKAALARAAANATPEELKKIRAAVAKKFPDMEIKKDGK